MVYVLMFLIIIVTDHVYISKKSETPETLMEFIIGYDRNFIYTTTITNINTVIKDMTPLKIFYKKYTCNLRRLLIYSIYDNNYRDKVTTLLTPCFSKVLNDFRSIENSSLRPFRS